MKQSKNKKIIISLTSAFALFLSGCSDIGQSNSDFSSVTEISASDTDEPEENYDTSDSVVSEISSETDTSSENQTSVHTHALIYHEANEATCTEEGNAGYWQCSECGRFFSDSNGETEIDRADAVIKAKGHQWDTENIDWKWADDYSLASATFTCLNDSNHTETVKATVVSDVTNKTCTEDGEGTYTATVEFDGKTYTDVLESVDQAVGHDFDEDYICRTCGYEAGLAFTLGGNGKTYSVSGIGNYADNFADENGNFILEIPDTYKGLPVAAVSDSAFSNNSAITDIVIPESVIEIGDSAFENCTSLTGLSIPGSVSSVGCSAFKGCSSLNTITMADGVETIDSAAFINCTSLASIMLPESVVSIGDKAFDGCSTLSAVYFTGYSYTLSYSFPYGTVYCYSDEEPDTEGNFWHYGSEGAPEIWTTLHNHVWDTEKIEWHWSEDYSSATATISCIHESSPHTEIIDADVTCENSGPCDVEGTSTYTAAVEFKGVTYENQVKVNREASEHVFEGESHTCSVCGYREGLYFSLSSDSLSYAVRSIGKYSKYFAYDSGKCDLVIPDTYKGLPVTSFREAAFFGESSIRSLVIGNNVVSIDEYAFQGSSVTDVVIGTGVTDIKVSAFEFCMSLTSIEIPDNVLSIGEYAFDLCTSLNYVVIGSGVTSIGSDAFCDCTSLQYIFYKGSSYSLSYSFSYGTMYYYSETKPATEGNFWHYDSEGKPVVWEEESNA